MINQTRVATTLFLAASMLFMLGAEPASNPSTATAPATDLATLIGQLSSGDRKARADAQDALSRLDQNKRVELQAMAREASDPQLRQRAEAALKQLQTLAVIGVSPVTLHVKNAPAKDVFNELARQGKCTLHVMPDNLWDPVWFGGKSPVVSLDADGQPLLMVLREFCRQVPVIPQAFQEKEDRGLMFNPSHDGRLNGPACTSGPFMLIASSITRSRDLTHTEAQPELTVQLLGFAEPKLHLLGAALDVNVDSASDENGASLMPSKPASEVVYPLRQHVLNPVIRLRLPPNPGGKIVKLSGTLRVLLQTATQTLEVKDILGAAQRRLSAGSTGFLINSVQKQGENEYDIDLTISTQGPPPADWRVMWDMLNPASARLIDERGRELACYGSGSGPPAGDGFHGHMQFYGAAEFGHPIKLVWEVPTETHDSRVAVEFTDLPMP